MTLKKMLKNKNLLRDLELKRPRNNILFIKIMNLKKILKKMYLLQ